MAKSAYYGLIGLFVLVAISVGPEIAPVASQADRAPYIYYHSEALNSIVIERADGTDSRSIARGLMPDQHDYVRGIGWSPSGEWLAWISAQKRDYNTGPERIWIMSADGTQRLTLLDELEYVHTVSWSPTGDYLVVFNDIYRPSHSPVTAFTLVDVAQQRIVASFDDMVLEFGYPARYWSADGLSVELMGFDFVRVVYVDGRIEDNVPAELRPPLAEPMMPYYDEPPAEERALAPDRRHEVVMDGNLIEHDIRNLLTGEVVTLRPFSGESYGIIDFDWHSSGDWLLVTFNMTWAGGCCPWTGTSIVSVDGRIQRELGPTHLYDHSADWLPERVIEHLAPGNAHSVVPEPLLVLDHDAWVRGVGWHPDGRTLATYAENSDYENMLTIWDAGADSPYIIDQYPVEVCLESFLWDCDVIWNATQTQIALTSLGGTQIIDVETGEVVLTSDDYLLGFAADDTPLWEGVGAVISFDANSMLIARAGWGEDDSLQVFSAVDRKIIYELPLDHEHYRRMDAMVFVPGTNYIAFVGNPGEFVDGAGIWNPVTGELAPLLSHNLRNTNELKAFDAETFLSYGRISLLYFWDVETRSVVARLNRHAFAVDVSADRTRMATGAGYLVEIWDYQTIVDQLSGD